MILPNKLRILISEVRPMHTPLHTPLCDRLGIEYPIFLAGMGGVAMSALTAAVSNAGGLGIMGAATLDPQQLRDEIRKSRDLTDKPFAVDLLAPDPEMIRPHMQVVFEEDVRIFVAGPGLVAPLAVGAEGAITGTRFIATPEAQAAPGYRDALVRSTEADTMRTRAYTGKTARTIKTDYAPEWGKRADEVQA